jgi:hypothetical protein
LTFEETAGISFSFRVFDFVTISQVTDTRDAKEGEKDIQKGLCRFLVKSGFQLAPPTQHAQTLYFENVT